MKIDKSQDFIHQFNLICGKCNSTDVRVKAISGEDLDEDGYEPGFFMVWCETCKNKFIIDAG